jgi:hypothetical protein
MFSMNEHDISQLTDMGFPESEARAALQITRGNLEVAVNQLLSGVGLSYSPPSAVAPSSSVDTTTTVVQGNTSQYTFADIGRSACTCIALTGAGMFLSTQGSSTSVTPDFLDRMITQGIENYQALATTMIQSSNNNSTTAVVEHMSAEEVLQQAGGSERFGVQSTAGGVRQGILSHDRDHPLGLNAILEGICMESQSQNKRLCLLMTKTPESVLICIPPQGTCEENAFPNNASSFWLVDSHPRPQCGTSNAYATQHLTLDSLLQSLYTIFPTTDLGPDIPEIMAQMYNSFDLYPLEKS